MFRLRQVVVLDEGAEAEGRAAYGRCSELLRFGEAQGVQSEQHERPHDGRRYVEALVQVAGSSRTSMSRTPPPPVAVRASHLQVIHRSA